MNEELYFADVDGGGWSGVAGAVLGGWV